MNGVCAITVPPTGERIMGCCVRGYSTDCNFHTTCINSQEFATGTYCKTHDCAGDQGIAMW